MSLRLTKLMMKKGKISVFKIIIKKTLKNNTLLTLFCNNKENNIRFFLNVETSVNNLKFPSQ